MDEINRDLLENDPVFNRKEFVARMMDDEDIAREVVSVFLNDIPLRIAEINEVLEEKNAEKLRAAAHQLKGSAANIGATRLYKIAMKLENNAKDGDLVQSAELVPLLMENARKLIEELKHF